MKFRIRFADQIVGAFVIIAMVLLIFMLLALGSQQRWFAKDYTFHSRFPSGYGLSRGMSVQLKGFKIGRITKITLNSENEAEVYFDIQDNFRDRVRENSILELTISPIGLGNSLSLHPGFSDKLLEEFSFVPSYETPQAQRMLERGLVDRPPKDDSISRILSNVNPMLENLNTTVIHVNAMLAGINGQDGRRVEQLFDEVESSIPGIRDDLDAKLASIGHILENLEGTSDFLRDPTGMIPSLIDPDGSMFKHIEGSLAELESTLSILRQSTEVLSLSMPRIGATIEQLRATVDTANDVLEGVKNNPLIRGGVPNRNEAGYAPQGARTTDF